MTAVRIRNRSAAPMSDGTTTIKPGDTHEFSDVCAAVRFVNGTGGAFLENTPGAVVQGINRAAKRAGCGEQVTGTVVAPTEESDATEVVPLGGDTAASQGAPKPVGQPMQVEVHRTAYGEPGDDRTPAEALHDPKHPATEGQVQGQAMASGKDLAAATAEVERGLRGDPPEGEPRSTHAGEKSQHAAQGGDPVDLFSGRLALVAVDLELASPFFEFALVRRYLSGAPAFGPFGFNWDHNWNVYLRPLASGDMARWTGSLHEDVFAWDGAQFQPPRGVFEQLVPLPHQRYELRARHGLVYRFERPPGYTDPERIPLVEIRDRYANRVRLTYDGRQLRRVEDDDGRALIFTYGRCGIVETIEDHSGRRVEYLHDDAATHLVAVRGPATRDFPQGRLTHYEYLWRAPHPLLRHCIARIFDHHGNLILDNLYQADPASLAFGRILAQRAGNFLWQFAYEQIQWVPEAAEFVGTPATRTLMLDPGGAVWTYTFNYRGDLLDERVRLVRDKSYRVIVTRRTFDAAGNLVVLQRPDGSRVEWRYDDGSPDPRARSNLLRVELRAAGLIESRIVLRASHDPAYQFPRELTYETGAKVTLEYDLSGDLREIRWPVAELPDDTPQTAVTRLDYDFRGLLVRQTSPMGRVRTFAHELPGTPLGGLLREQHEDPDGADLVTRFEYDASGHLSAWTAPGGATWRQTVNALGQVEDIEQPEINGSVDLIRHFYNAQGKLVRVERPRGELKDAKLTGDILVDAYRWTPLGHLKWVSIADNTGQFRVWEFECDWEGRVVVAKDPAGCKTKTVYDERGLVLRVENNYETPEELTTRWTYDRAGRVVREEDPAGDVRLFECDAWGRPLKTTDPNGTTTELSYGLFDLPAEEIITGDPGDGPPRVLKRTRWDHDARGRLIRHIAFLFENDPAAAIPLETSYWRDRDGLCREVHDLNGTITHKYDALGRRTRTTDPLGNVTRTDYGPDGRPLRITDEDQGDPPMTRWTELHHDARGRLIATLRPDGPVLTQRWDARDLLVELTDALGVVTRREYGPLGELVGEHVDPGGLDLIYTHDCDPVGREVRFADPTSAVTETERDRLGRIRRVDLPGGAHVQHQYDKAGRLARTIGPDGAEQRFEYKAGRIHALESSGGPALKPVPKHTYTHDGLGRLVRAQAGDSDIHRRYDSLDRLRREDNNGQITALEIDDVARTARLVYPDQRRELHRLDALGRVIQIELESPGDAGLDGGPPGILVQASYVGPGRLASLRYANGTATHLTYDPLGRLGRVKHTDAQALLLGTVNLRLDRGDHRRLLVRSGPDPLVRLHGFDAHARLAELRAGFAPPELGELDQAAQDAAITAAELAAAEAPLHQSWTLTGADTPEAITTTENNVQSLVQRDLGPHHQVLAVDGAPHPHDPAGRRTADPERVFWYDALGRLAEVSAADSLAVLTAHTYDALGRLSVETRLGQPVRTLYFGPLALHEETAGGLALRQYTHHSHAAGPVLATTAFGPLALHPGAFGDLALVTGLLGQPLLRYDYAVFGAPIVRDGNAAVLLPADALGLRPRWGGMIYVPESGLYLASARAYDPIAALYLTPDPALHLGSPSPYTYCAHNPVDRHDPGGELWGGLLFGAIGAAFSVIQTWRSDPDADAWDLLAAGTIGFGAGFVGATTFGWASAGITRGLLSVAGRSSIALGSKTSIALSVTSGIGAGAISGGLSGGLAGVAGGTYEAARYGGDAWELIKSGTLREGISGMAAGAVGGGLFQGALRAGVLPKRAWGRMVGTRRRAPQSWGGRASAVALRGVASPAGLGFVGVGLASGFTGGLADHLQQGGDLGSSLRPALDSAIMGGIFGLAATALNPVTYQYWRARADTGAAVELQRARRHTTGRHHQRNVAQYPEYSTPASPQNSWFDNLVNRFTRGNVEGPSSVIPSEAVHEAWHRQWGRGGSLYGKIPTHGPWTPEILPTLTPAGSLPTNHKDR